MLGYVFWHGPRDDVSLSGYEAALMRFHATLASQPPSGFLGSFSTRTSRLPWLDAVAAYEDWYLLSGSAALDALDAAALDVRRRAAHDDAARGAGTGAAGLYRLKSGTPSIPRRTIWFGKPEGTTYTDFAPILEKLAQDGGTLWQRRMVLGPAPEYALQGREPFPCNVSGIRVTHGTFVVNPGDATLNK